MDLLHGSIRQIYFKYLAASFGSALVVSVYSLVDCAMVGRYEGPNGVAALAVIMPVWNVIFSFGLMFGIGGAVLLGIARGAQNEARANRWFTSALIGAVAVTVLITLMFVFFDGPLLRLFGANDSLLPLARRYLASLKFAVPLFLMGQFLVAFLRNDGAPGRATAAFICGGLFNIFGDWFFVFVCDMGIFGAGLATSLGQIIAVAILCSHFFCKKCTLRLVRPIHFWADLTRICSTGFSAFFLDIAVGILSTLFNNQIMRWSGAPALAVYGVIINIAMLVQSCAYAVGQSAQPLLSQNFGAGLFDRVKTAFHCGLFAALASGLVWTAVLEAFPLPVIRLFMTPTPEVLAIAVPIMRCYFLSCLLQPFNIFSTYYFQAVLRPGAAFGVSVVRGLVVSAALLWLLPSVLGANGLWLVMPLTELCTALLVAILLFGKVPSTLQE